MPGSGVRVSPQLLSRRLGKASPDRIRWDAFRFPGLCRAWSSNSGVTPSMPAIIHRRFFAMVILWAVAGIVLGLLTSSLSHPSGWDIFAPDCRFPCYPSSSNHLRPQVQYETV